MSDGGPLVPAPTREELGLLGDLLGLPKPHDPKAPSNFLRSLARSFLLAPALSEERCELDEMVERVAAEEGVETEGLLRAESARLRAEGLLT